ncbi:SNF2 family N-terminal domain [Carpediemonas membranifera]|uniref:SNF2 family N-terminal domain n=1 Tax=Carpediemonas membranifera TaxID=201153 RepID=A0A8J6AYA0_9EUKA|nr:SNF2 family N-terminal domain [Carpediemonas membranifera]|eukprot:KAG9397048.1 SNF2 family N-terminal domain [Carpediemonas membranifera]
MEVLLAKRRKKLEREHINGRWEPLMNLPREGHDAETDSGSSTASDSDYENEGECPICGLDIEPILDDEPSCHRCVHDTGNGDNIAEIYGRRVLTLSEMTEMIEKQRVRDDVRMNLEAAEMDPDERVQYLCRMVDEPYVTSIFISRYRLKIIAPMKLGGFERHRNCKPPEDDEDDFLAWLDRESEQGTMVVHGEAADDDEVPASPLPKDEGAEDVSEAARIGALLVHRRAVLHSFGLPIRLMIPEVVYPIEGSSDVRIKYIGMPPSKAIEASPAYACPELPVLLHRAALLKTDPHSRAPPRHRKTVAPKARDYYHETALGHFKNLTRTPPHVHGELLPFQLDGVNWLRAAFVVGQPGVILADDMGCGKTIQTLAFLASLADYGIYGPFLVVVGLSVLDNWAAEARKWCPDMHVVPFYGDKADREALMELELTPAIKGKRRIDIVLTTYNQVILSGAKLAKLIYPVMIVDEAHRLKSESSQLRKQLQQYTLAVPSTVTTSRKQGMVLLLTGTPMQNTIGELHTLLKFIDPKKFPSMEDFVGTEDADPSMMLDAAIGQLEDIHKKLRSVMLRRRKQDVLPHLPPKKELLVPVDMLPEQRIMYRHILEAGIDPTTRKLKMACSNLLMQLRKCCNNGLLTDNRFKETLMDMLDNGTPEDTLKRILSMSGKMSTLVTILHALIKRGDRFLVYSQFTSTLDLIAQVLELEGIEFVILDGRVSRSDREESILRFNNENIPVFLLSTRAGGEGLNLVQANTVIIFDSDWNPHRDIQALCRTHRVGQQRPVHVFKLVTRGTVEEKILAKAKSKLVADHVVVKRMDRATLTETEIQELVKFGARKLFEDDAQPDGESTIVYKEADILSMVSTVDDLETQSAQERNALSKAFHAKQREAQLARIGSVIGEWEGVDGINLARFDQDVSEGEAEDVDLFKAFELADYKETADVGDDNAFWQGILKSYAEKEEKQRAIKRSARKTRLYKRAFDSGDDDEGDEYEYHSQTPEPTPVDAPLEPGELAARSMRAVAMQRMARRKHVPLVVHGFTEPERRALFSFLRNRGDIDLAAEWDYIKQNQGLASITLKGALSHPSEDLVKASADMALQVREIAEMEPMVRADRGTLANGDEIEPFMRGVPNIEMIAAHWHLTRLIKPVARKIVGTHTYAAFTVPLPTAGNAASKDEGVTEWSAACDDPNMRFDPSSWLTRLVRDDYVNCFPLMGMDLDLCRLVQDQTSPSPTWPVGLDNRIVVGMARHGIDNGALLFDRTLGIMETLAALPEHRTSGHKDLRSVIQNRMRLLRKLLLNILDPDLWAQHNRIYQSRVNAIQNNITAGHGYQARVRPAQPQPQTQPVQQVQAQPGQQRVTGSIVQSTTTGEPAEVIEID